jgi:hypothetical protein
LRGGENRSAANLVVRGASLVESPAIDSSYRYRHATNPFPSNKEDDKKKESKKRQREIRHDFVCLVCCDSVATGIERVRQSLLFCQYLSFRKRQGDEQRGNGLYAEKRRSGG